MSFGSLEFYLFGAGALIMALEQSLRTAPRLTARFPILQWPHWVRYLPFVLWLIGVAVHFSPIKLQPEYSDPEVSGIPIEAIAISIDGATDAQRTELLKPFSSLKAKVSGSVNNVTVHERSFGIIFLQGSLDGRRLNLVFDGQLDRLGGLALNSKVKADCHFGYLDSQSITLNGCVLR